MNMKDLEKAAKKEDWDYINAELPKICNDPETLARAQELLGNSNENLRDLGASTLQLTTQQLSEEAESKLYDVMTKSGFDSLRAACALAEHGIANKKVVAKLHEFESNPDQEAAEEAKKYLAKL